MNKQNLLFWIFVIFASSIFGQIAHFPFNTNMNDIVNGYVPTAFGSPTIITDGSSQVLQLEGDEYLSLPNALHQAIDPNQNLEIQIRFKITDFYDTAPFSGTGEFGEEGTRILLSNKHHFIFDSGFDIYVKEMDEEYRILMSFGDDSEEGTWVFKDAIQPNTWIDFKLIMRLNDDIPHMVYKLNGYYYHYPLNYLDVDIFKASLNTQQLWIGTDKDNELTLRDYAYAETSIDYLKIYNPISAGNTTLFSSALNAMTNHVNGNNVLTEAQQRDQLTIIVDNWDDNIGTVFHTDILNYITAYEQAEGTVFQFYAEYIDPLEVSIPRALQLVLIQYAIDNLYTTTNVASMAGVSFLDHTITPGIVEPSAPRVNQSINIDGDYNTNPGYYMNQQSFVIRPTGYYAAPGESVNITVPSSIVNQNVIIHVGAHFKDFREDHRGFQRFPTMTTKFPITSTSISVANPLGGAIYFIFPDGSNFGSTSIGFNNAVKSPYYSSKTGFSNSLSNYQTDLSNAYVNWVDMESDNFMATFPKALAEMSPDASAMLTPLNDMLGNYNIIAGRPATKIRSEYMISEPAPYTDGTIPASYPISIPNGNLNEAIPEALPVSVLNPSLFMQTYEGTTMLHELCHLHNMPTMDDNGETNVDVPSVMAFNTVFNLPIDTALYYAAFFQVLDGDQAALDWILDSKFRNNIAAGFEDVSYQVRGIAKYTDVARLFSWDSLGLIHKHWYDEALLEPEPPLGIRNVSPDEYMQVASDQLGFNFAPLWELWGSIPSQALVNQLDSYTKENRIKERILYYRTLVPNNAAEFLTVYNSITPNIEEHHQERYDALLTYYDESVADSIHLRIDEILCRYYDTNCELCEEDNLLLNQNSIQSGTYKAAISIRSSGQLAIGNTIFQAGDFIAMEPGFNAPAGSDFLAKIDPATCNVTSSFTSNDQLDNFADQPKILIAQEELLIMPNPFVDNPLVQYKLPVAQKIQIQLFTIDGKLLSTVSEEFHEAGTYEVKLTGLDNREGIFFLVLKTEKNILTKKIIKL